MPEIYWRKPFCSYLLKTRCAWSRINTSTYQHQSCASSDHNPNTPQHCWRCGRGTGLFPGQVIGTRILVAGWQTPPSLCLMNSTSDCWQELPGCRDPTLSRSPADITCASHAADSVWHQRLDDISFWGIWLVRSCLDLKAWGICRKMKIFTCFNMFRVQAYADARFLHGRTHTHSHFQPRTH